ncbi:MAG: M10 family metallopeptidase [Thermodesulfobacteriota bacterium]|nr:M10 family metallopeptidase [Thermodesulfobacteriota bacterium]
MQTSSVSSTGINCIDSLLTGDKWGDAAGIAATLSYSFPYADSTSALWERDYSDDNEPWNFSIGGLNTTQQQAAVLAVQQWASVANIDFNEVQEGGDGVGAIRFTLIDSPTEDETWGWAYFPSSYGETGGDVWLNAPVLEQEWDVGSVNFSSLLHELGHALGFKHSFEDGVTLPTDEDSNQYTVMSYTEHKYANYREVTETATNYSWTISPVQPQTPMLYDIAAMQHLYGANMDYATEDDLYTFDPQTPFFKTIWDAAGNDTLSVQNFTENCLLDLRAGKFSTLTILSDSLPEWSTEEEGDAILYDGTDNLAIAFNVVIENAMGGRGNDVFIGNSVDNILTGGEGIDFLISDEILSGSSVQKLGEGLAFELLHDAGDIDSLVDIERLIFSDKGLALDLSGAAGKAAKILGATFGAESVDNSAYVKIGLDLLGDGMSYEDLTALAIEAAGATTNEQVVDLLWTNLVGSHPSSAQAQPYVQMLNDGMSAGELGVFAADLELNHNNIDLLGLAQTGLVFDLA